MDEKWYKVEDAWLMQPKWMKNGASIHSLERWWNAKKPPKKRFCRFTLRTPLALYLSLSLLRARARARFDLLQRASFSLFSGVRFRLLLPLRRLASPRLARTPPVRPSVRPSLRASCIFIRAWVLPFFRFHALFLLPYLHELF
jgi:hypothetical protein